MEVVERNESSENEQIPNKPVLQGYWKSPCSWRIRMILNLKKIEYEYFPTNQEEMEAKLIVDNHVLTDTMAVAEHFEGKRSKLGTTGLRLINKRDPKAATKIIRLCELIS